MIKTLTIQDRIIKKFDNFIKDKVNYIVEDINDPRVGHYAREDIKQFLIYAIKEVEEETRKKEIKKWSDASNYLMGLEIPEHDVTIDLEFRPRIMAMSVGDYIKCEALTERLKIWTKIWTWKLEKRLKKQILSITNKEKQK